MQKIKSAIRDETASVEVKCWTVKLLVITGCKLVLHQICSGNPEVGVVELEFFAIKTKPKVKNCSGSSNQADSLIISVKISLYLNYLSCPGEQRKEKGKKTLVISHNLWRRDLVFKLVSLVLMVTPACLPLAVVFLCDPQISFWAVTRMIHLLSHEGRSSLSNLRSIFKCSLAKVV